MPSRRPRKEKPEKHAAWKLRLGGTGHTEKKKDETKIRKAEDATGRGIRDRINFKENPQQ